MYNRIMPKSTHSRSRTTDYELKASSWDLRLSSGQPFQARAGRWLEPGDLQVSLHDGLEVGVLLSGELALHIDDVTMSCRPGSVWLFGMWEPHEWRITEPMTQQVGIVFLPEFLGNEILENTPWMKMFAARASERPIELSARMRERALRIGHDLRDEIESDGPYRETAIRLEVAHLLLMLSQEWRPPEGLEPTPRAVHSRLKRIMPALEAVHARPVGRIRTADAAAACGLSVPQFARVFRQLTGLSFARFQMRSHLAFAAHLLLTTAMSVEAVASRSGFVDASHLHRNFVRQYAVAPGAYRQRAQRPTSG